MLRGNFIYENLKSLTDEEKPDLINLNLEPNQSVFKEFEIIDHT